MQIQPNGYDTVLFDLDGTLRVNDPPALDVFYRIAAELGLETSPELRIVGERWVNEYWADSELLKEDLDRFGDYRDNAAFWKNHAWRHLRHIGADEQLADGIAGTLTERMREEYQPRDVVPESVLPTLENLKQSGFRLGLVSNRSKPMNELVEELGLAQHFEIILAAGEVGWYKPDPRLLEHAARQLKTTPSASIYIGDNYHADVLGARAAGMEPVLIDPRSIYADADCVVIKDIGEIERIGLRVTVGLD
ncbi:MAG: HAD family hydrolase [Anaerolineales bacterium]|jgi:HAD superfamily hydrolase (TIGR01662 family)